MATFIPEWVRVSGSQVHIKRVLGALDNEFVVRRPMRSSDDPPALFVQHPRKGWLAVAVEESPFAALDGASQLLDSPHQHAFEQRLAKLGRLAAADAPEGREQEGREQARVPALVLMWVCSVDEVRVLSRAYLERFGVRLVAKDQFLQLGAKLVPGLMAPLQLADEQALLGTWFPEAEVPAVFTARRVFRRDNRATLGRYFLDADQEWASKLDIDLPHEQAHIARDFSVRLLNGVAGSGKTLIAVNRARLLAELFPQQRLLLLIHNTPIVADIKERWHRSAGGLPPNLEVTTFFAWASRQWRNVFGKSPRMPEDSKLLTDAVQRWRDQQRDPQQRPSNEGRAPRADNDALATAWTDKLLLDEVDFINEALLHNEADYLAANRTGRGFALRPHERSVLWRLHAELTDSLGRRGMRLWSALPRDLCHAKPALLARGLQTYHHVMVDEAQFFAPSWFQLVKQAVLPGGQLFVCADPNQGFMRSRLSWKSVGLDVTGRTKKLRRSYRTTRAILESAGGVLAHLSTPQTHAPQTPHDAVDDDFLQPDFSGMDAGTPPLLVYTDSAQDSVDRLVNELVAVTARGRVPLHAVLVLYGDHVNKPSLHRRLTSRFGRDQVWWFNEKSQKREPPQGYGRDYLRMAYVDTATGLEAAVVFLVGMEPLFRDASTGADPSAGLREDHARKLYMAMTRAGQRLVLLSSQRLPHAVERWFEVTAPLAPTARAAGAAS